MDREIRRRYTPAILDQASQRYGIRLEQIRSLDAFESFIFAYRRDETEAILRLSHSLRRSRALIQAEVDWINYLAAGGTPAARALPSLAGRLVEAIDDEQGGQFLATAFERAPGRPPWEAGWTPERYEAYGRLLAGMHARSQVYQPPDPACRRPDWDDPLMDFVGQYLPPDQTAIRRKYQALCEHLRTLPRDPTCYGLIHQDAHEANLLMDEAGGLTVIDFDDCVYSWYANDLAIALFYIVQGEADPPVFTRAFLTSFLRGYRQVNPLSPGWLKEFPVFLKMREIELYAVIHRDFDVLAIDDPWCARFMDGRRARLQADTPTLEFDFGEWI